MPKLKLTETAVARLKAPDPSGKQVPYWDTELKGFGVMCSGASSSKSYVAQFDLPGGKTRRVTIGAVSGTTLEEARKQAWDIIHALRKGDDPKAKKPAELTLRGALEAYLAKRTLRDASIAAYRLSIEKYLTAWLDKPLREITGEMVEARYREIAREVIAGKAESAKKRARSSKQDSHEKPKGPNPLFTGTATANSSMRSLKIIWTFAADFDATLPPNPVRRLKKQWVPEKPREGKVKAGELRKFYDALCELKNDTQRDYLKLVLFTGMRRTEAASLKWEQIDFELGFIRIPGDTTKTKRPLDLPMSDVVHDLLAARAAKRVAEIAFVFPADSDSGHISEPRFALDSVCERAGVSVSIHDLRRTFVTVAGTVISARAQSALVNHSLGKGITASYDQAEGEDFRRAAQAVTDKLKSLCGIAAPAAAAAARPLVDASA